jgi:hypothetical protein
MKNRKINQSKRRQQFMHLSQLAAAPKLIEIKLEDEETIKEYGEPLVFHTWDRQPMDTFIQLASLSGADIPQLISVAKTLILNAEGKEILVGDTMLPVPVLMAAINKVTDILGKF